MEERKAVADRPFTAEPVGADALPHRAPRPAMADAGMSDVRDVTFESKANVPTVYGMMQMRVYREHPTGKEIVVVVKGEVDRLERVPVRVHDQCVTSEVFGSVKCDCKQQLAMAQKHIARCGGMVIYLQQEGRGIGLANKIAAYHLQESGYDTVDANTALGLPDDCRDYSCVPLVLRHMGVKVVSLMTNNPRKMDELRRLGVCVQERIPIVANPHPEARKYLETKARRSGHMIPRADNGRSPRVGLGLGHEDGDDDSAGMCIPATDAPSTGSVAPPVGGGGLTAATTSTQLHRSAMDQHHDASGDSLVLDLNQDAVLTEVTAASRAVEHPPAQRGIVHMRPMGSKFGEAEMTLLHHLQQSIETRSSYRPEPARPHVTLAFAQSMDACLSLDSTMPLRLSGEESMRLTHAIRSLHDAILVGINTVLADNPLLNVRLIHGPSPRPIILDGNLRVPKDARLFSENARPIIFTNATIDGAEDAAKARRRGELEQAGAVVVECRVTADGKLDMPWVFRCLRSQFHINAVMVEGGGRVIDSLLSTCMAPATSLVDHVVVTVAPCYVGGGRTAPRASPGANAPAIPMTGDAAEALRSKWHNMIRFEDVRSFQLNNDIIVHASAFGTLGAHSSL